MQRTIFIFLIRLFMFYNHCNFTRAKALVGPGDIYDIEASHFPSVVCLIKNSVQDLTLSRLCTGTFISNYHILTAEHCFYETTESFKIFAGSHRLNESTVYYPMWFISYDIWTQVTSRPLSFPYNDISVLKILGVQLSSSVISYVKPISRVYGYKIDVVGCGLANNRRYPNTKQTAKLKIISEHEYENRISRLQGNHLILTNRLLCTVAEPFVFLGDGDSGSPVFYFNTIIAMGVSVCPVTDNEYHPDKVNLHLNLEFYTDFIDNMLWN